MKKVIFVLFILSTIYSCSKTESAPPVTKLSSCDSVKQALFLLTTSDSVRLVSCLTITGCDSISLGILKPSTQDLLRLNCNISSITIGTQIWMKMNLDIVTYRNGDIIPQVTDPTAWAGLTTGAWCYYNNNNTTTGSKYGKLYNWYAVNDSRGLAPRGWHIPTQAEWIALGNRLDGSDVAGGKLKEAGTLNWKSPNANATNITGFTALPGGGRSPNGQFFYFGTDADFWSATQSNSTEAFLSGLTYLNGGLSTNITNGKKGGYSIRCIRD